MYLKRHAEKTINKLSKMFGAVLVAGPRQVGKTTLLQNMTEGIAYVTLDDPIILMSAAEQEGTFFNDNPPPVFIDEIQRAPGLFLQMKLLIDRKKEKGMFYLCGSQQFQMMEGVSESLAGRIGLITLLGISLRERYGIEFDVPFIPTQEYFSARKNWLKSISYDDIWKAIARGSMPELCVNPDYDWRMFYGAYVRTYIERDVRELTQIGDEIKFMRFMEALASMTGQLLNVQSVANDIGISLATANRWLSILTASNIIYLLKPYSSNYMNRAIKTPKIYFLDTGLAAYLTRWNTYEVMKTGAMAGAFFETFVVSEIIKSYYNVGILEPPIYFYRDKDKVEIDIIIEDNNTLYPLEIKKHADPSIKDFKNMEVLDKLIDKSEGKC